MILLAHEDDRPNTENINITLYPFEEEGYQIRSISQMDFSHFLSYKIERSTLLDSDSDMHYSLNSIAPTVTPLSGLDIIIEDKKYDYLMRAGRLIKGGLVDAGKAQLAEMIRSKLEGNYIYNLRYMREHEVRSFNVVLEVQRAQQRPPVRMNVSLEYQPENGCLRLITLY